MKALSLHDQVLQSVWNIPGLFYKKTWEESELAVYHQFFCVLGNGMDLELIEGKYQFPKKSKYKLPNKKTAKRLMAGEELLLVNDVDHKRSVIGGKVFWDIHSRKDDTRIFLSDYKEKCLDYPIAYEDQYSPDQTLCISEILPPDYGSRAKPYPFSFEYLPFVKINPYGKNYGYGKKNPVDMPVEELRESKNLIPDEYSKAIVKVYAKGLEFFDSQAFFDDNYFGLNCKPSDPFYKKIERSLQNEDEFNLFNSNYSIPLQKDDTPETYLKRSAVSRQTNYVTLSKKIIEAFSE